MLYAFFWVIPRRLYFTCQRFGTVCLFHLHRRAGMKILRYLPAYEDGTDCSETSAYQFQRPGNCPEESIQHSEHGESLKSRINVYCFNIMQHVTQLDTHTRTQYTPGQYNDSINTQIVYTTTIGTLWEL